MKHKYFNEVYPYAYYLVRKRDKLKYVGVRYANVRLGLTPNEDFGKEYFTSGKLKRHFKNNLDLYDFRLVYTFDTVEEAFEWESSIVMRIYKYPDWANEGWARNYGENPNIGRLISEGKNKIGGDGLSSVERGRKTLLDWIYTTEDGRGWRRGISNRKKQWWANVSEEDVKKMQDKRRSCMDFKAASAKAKVTMLKVGEDGLNGYQRAAIKSAETIKKKGTDLSENSRIGNETFDRNMGTMTEEEFEKYCEGKSERAVKIYKTRRKKWLDSQTD